MTRIGPYGMTKAEYDAAVAKRNGRPLTMTDPIQLHRIDDQSKPNDGLTLLERVIAEAISEDRKNRGK